MMDKLFSGLKVEHWYHIFIIFGGLGTIASLIFDIKGITNTHAFLLFIGIFFVGIGEWINHPLKTGLMRPNPYAPGGAIIHGNPRKNKFSGVLFDIFGLLSILTAAYKIAKEG